MKDQISALIDNEYDVDAADHLLTALKHDVHVTECWATYHLIGDAMRGELALRSDFSQRLQQQLNAEPTVLAPKRSRKILGNKHHQPAFWMSAAASVAAVMFVGWVVLQTQARQSGQDIPAATVAQNVVSPESVNSYLVAHQSTFAGSGMQAAYYVRPVALSENGN
jgi:sigma-E factor negative regulatory protein RseA